MRSLLKLLVCIFTINLFLSSANAGLADYFISVRTYFGYDDGGSENTSLEGFETQIPYEVAEIEEKFIAHAIELTGVAISDLDTCQHRLILKLKTDCHTMNDILISKLAVGLLNCQSYIEGRKVFPCTEEMTLKQCTSGMDPDVWTSYLLMTNRAKAVCYSIRQSQFRGLTEDTVNRLMQAAQYQMHTLHKVAKEQEDLHNIAHDTLDSITQGNADLAQQQKDIQKAQLFGQLQLEDNINKLADEKRMIMESQKQLAYMTKTVQEKLTDAAEQIEKQSVDTSSNHHEILEDLVAIQDKAQVIFQRIEDSTNMLLIQSELATKQYEATLGQLQEMNKTVHSLVSLVGGTKQALEERLSWITTALGGTDDAIERLYTILWHVLFLLIGMIACAFVSAHVATRFAVISLIPINLAMCLAKYEHAADAVTLGGVLGLYIVTQSLVLSAWRFTKTRKQLAVDYPNGNSSFAHSRREHASTPTRSRSNTPNTTPENSVFNAEVSRITGDYTPTREVKNYSVVDGTRDYREKYDRFDDYLSPTPPVSRNNYRAKSGTPNLNGSIKVTCSAMTRLGTPCRNVASGGKDACFRHQKGDSVMR